MKLNLSHDDVTALLSFRFNVGDAVEIVRDCNKPNIEIGDVYAVRMVDFTGITVAAKRSGVLTTIEPQFLKKVDIGFFFEMPHILEKLLLKVKLVTIHLESTFT